MFLLHLDSLLMHEISATECNVKTLNVYNNSVNNLVNAFALNLTVLHTESVGLQLVQITSRKHIFSNLFAILPLVQDSTFLS